MSSVKQVEKDITDLQEKRGVFKTELQALETEIESLNDQLSDAILSGQGTSKLENELGSCQARKIAHEGALLKLNNLLFEKQGELDESRIAELEAEVNEANEAWRKEFYEYAKSLVEWNKRQGECMEKANEFRSRAERLGRPDLAVKSGQFIALWPGGELSTVVGSLTTRKAYMKGVVLDYLETGKPPEFDSSKAG